MAPKPVATLSAAKKKAFKQPKVVQKAARKASYIWPSEVIDVLLDCISSDWNTVHTKAVVTADYWNHMPNMIAKALVIETSHAQLDGMTGDSCKNKWKAMKAAVVRHAGVLGGSEGTGTEPDAEPACYVRIMGILGDSAAARGKYQSRNSIVPGLVERQRTPEPQPEQSTQDLTPISAAIQSLVTANDGDADSETDGDPDGCETAISAVTIKKRSNQEVSISMLDELRSSFKESVIRTPKPKKHKSLSDEMTPYQTEVVEAMKASNAIQQAILDQNVLQNKQIQERHEQLLLDQEARRKERERKSEIDHALKMRALGLSGKD
ncbi:hypothetical protein HDU79_000480 [Rhizoclosmatium sp. JEL0117]|nr:hypothetical protein HDU79_000480 [Rhizoclosmatium sp. JEL0117]